MFDLSGLRYSIISWLEALTLFPEVDRDIFFLIFGILRIQFQPMAIFFLLRNIIPQLFNVFLGCGFLYHLGREDDFSHKPPKKLMHVPPKKEPFQKEMNHLPESKEDMVPKTVFFTCFWSLKN